jgi:hypothetical protein
VREREGEGEKYFHPFFVHAAHGVYVENSRERRIFIPSS